MAITNTLKSKEFMAGASPIVLKGDYRPQQDTQMASMDANERELMRLVEEFMEQGFNQQEAIEAAKEELEKKSMSKGGRAHYGLGSLFKKVKKGVKGFVSGAKDILKSPVGLLALNFAPALIPGGASTFFGGANAKFNIGSLLGLSEKGGTVMDALKVGGAGAVITGLLADREQQPGEDDGEYAKRRSQVNDQLKVQFSRLYPQLGNETPEDYSVRIDAMVQAADDQTVDVANMAIGGRVNRAFGSDELVEQASGIEGLPININSKGVKELDMRDKGGFIPPVGVKEKADDIPAMLSNNEFVFTADAVRAAGGGSVNKGAQRMYDLMKGLEGKVS